MLSKLEKKHAQFSHRVGTVEYSREARTLSLEAARHLKQVIMEELRTLEADAKVQRILMESRGSCSGECCCCGQRS
eukprot:3507349-Prorocentrum_lima.AAC.1